MAKTAEQQARAQKARATLGWAILAFVLGMGVIVVGGALLPKVTNLVTTGITPHLPTWIATLPTVIVALVILVISALALVTFVVLLTQAITGDAPPKIAIVAFVLGLVLALSVGGAMVGNGTIPLTATPTPMPTATAPAAPAPAGATAGTPTPGATAVPTVPAPAGTPMP